MRILKILLIAALMLTLTACTASASNPGDGLKLVCTSFPCYDFARAVAGDLADVTLLIKPGSEVHSYEPTPANILEIAGADLFIYIGGESDAWVDGILESFGSDAPATLRLFDCVDALEEETQANMTLACDDGAPAQAETEYDEHIWTSPVNAQAMVKAVCDALSAADAQNAAVYAANAADYIAQISELDRQFRDAVESGARREMIFADRFPFLYFAREYGLDYYAAFPSCTAESEPSAKTLAFLIDRVEKDQIPVIYTIELSSGKTAAAVSEETGAKVLTFYSVQNLTEQDFSAGESYVSLMQKNLEALKEGLN